MHDLIHPISSGYITVLFFYVMPDYESSTKCCYCFGIFFLFLVNLFCTELFPIEIRSVGLGLSYNLGFCLFGGLGPTLATVLASEVTPFGPGILTSVAGVISVMSVLIALWSYERRHRRASLMVVHIRDEPY